MITDFERRFSLRKAKARSQLVEMEIQDGILELATTTRWRDDSGRREIFSPFLNLCSIPAAVQKLSGILYFWCD